MTLRQLSADSQPISPAKFAHFVLRTGQFEKMITWYETVLGARIVFRDERLCFLSYDDEHHRLALVNIPGLPVRDPDAVGTDHVAYAYNNLGELLSTYSRLKAAGIVPHWPINHGVTTSMYYRDPDNNRVELQIDNFATPAELDGYFHSRGFAENPVGVTYDPEQLCRRYEAVSRWRICSASRRCPRGRLRGTCWRATDRLVKSRHPLAWVWADGYSR
jgi:catechol 2,3-dioxygenase-like lactoylglutathione lyase family enzyme